MEITPQKIYTQIKTQAYNTKYTTGNSFSVTLLSKFS